MADEKQNIQIGNLPQKFELEKTDWLLVDDDEDTKKISVGLFEEYIDEQVGLVSESIQTKMDEATELVESIADEETKRQAKFEEYETAETQRESNEAARKSSEEARVTKFNEWGEYIDSLEVAEESRTAGYNEMKEFYEQAKIGEEIRQTNEDERNASEQLRKIAESQRVSDFTTIQNYINQVKSNEESRQSGYLDMVTYFSNVKQTVQDKSSTGLSNQISSAAKYVNVMDVIFKKGDSGYESNWYSCLLHINEIAEDEANNKSRFVYAAFKLNTTSSGDYDGVSYKLYGNSISTIDSDNICVLVSRTDTDIKLSFYYLATSEGSVVECHRLSDNITIFDDTNVLSKVYDGKDPVVSLPSSVLETLTLQDEANLATDNILGGSLEYHLIALMEQIQVLRSEMGNVKPVNLYPVGTVYETTTSTNPSADLGGGTWEMMYGGGITQTITDEAGNEVAKETTYKWKRTK